MSSNRQMFRSQPREIISKTRPRQAGNGSSAPGGNWRMQGGNSERQHSGLFGRQMGSERGQRMTPLCLDIESERV